MRPLRGDLMVASLAVCGIRFFCYLGIDVRFLKPHTKYVHSNIFRKNARYTQQKLIATTGAHIPLFLCSTIRSRVRFYSPYDFPFGSP